MRIIRQEEVKRALSTIFDTNALKIAMTAQFVNCYNLSSRKLIAPCYDRLLVSKIYRIPLFP